MLVGGGLPRIALGEARPELDSHVVSVFAHTLSSDTAVCPQSAPNVVATELVGNRKSQMRSSSDRARELCIVRLIGMTGATGAVFGIHFLENPRELPEVETHLVLSRWARTTIELETGISVGKFGRSSRSRCPSWAGRTLPGRRRGAGGHRPGCAGDSAVRTNPLAAAGPRASSRGARCETFSATSGRIGGTSLRSASPRWWRRSSVPCTG